MACESIGLVLSYMQEKNEPFASASSPWGIILENGQFLVVVSFDMNTYKNKIQAKTDAAAFTDFNELL